MSARSIANGLRKAQRDFLMAHIDGPHPITTHGREWAVRNSLLNHALIAYPIGGMKNPTSTHLTELGREVLGAILGDYADALVRAGCLEKAPPIKLVRNAPMIIPELAGREAELARVMAAD